MVYRKVKYHDEGNEYVSRSEFFAVHINFAVVEAWISYLLLFSIFVSVKQYIMYENSSITIEESDRYIQAFGITSHILML